MNSISIVSGAHACAVWRSDDGTVSIALRKGDSPIGQWNFFPEVHYNLGIAARRRQAVARNLLSLFGQLSRRGFATHEVRLICRMIVELVLLGGELSSIEAGSPFYDLVSLLTQVEMP